MSDNTMCCDKCFHEIAKISIDAAKAWMFLCKFRCELPRHMLMCYEEPLPSIAILENLGFVVTTERNDANRTGVKLIGQHEDDGIIFFCKENDHENC